MRSAFCITTVVISCTLAGGVRGQAEKTPRRNTALEKELHRMVAEDQDLRKRLIDLMNKGSPDVPAAMKQMQALDHKNTTRLKEIVAKHGWPGKSLVGEEGSHDAWLLVQHADQDRPFQKQCLELMRAGLARKEVSGQEVAYLTDRVLVGEKKPQKYGTQFEQRGGEWTPYPIEDEANVDQRRKEMGLQPLAEYAKALKQVYQAKGNDKK
jgi:hypothetical protein